MNRVAGVSFTVIAMLLALSPEADASGSLKVTSFPSGAEVWVDGAHTGKITPMSISLTEGDHTVIVRLPNSGWNPDTRTVTIVSGNNDLSVTLLPTLTQGAAGPPGPGGTQGPPGPAGAQGPPGAAGAQGPAGASATVRLAATSECQTGGIVVTSGAGDVSLPVCNGAGGPQGAQGIQGIQGSPGERGEPGFSGPAGPPGAPGGVPVVDPTTLVGFGKNLRVDIGGGLLPLGLSPVYVDIDTLTSTDRGRITYRRGKSSRLAPFAIAASRHLRDDGQLLPNNAPHLTAWFDLARQGDPSANRTVRFELSNYMGEAKLTVAMANCVPSTLDSDFGGMVRVVVQCHHVSDVTIVGGNVVEESGDSIHLPAPPFSRMLLLRVNNGGSVHITDVSGGGARFVRVGSDEYLGIDPIRLHMGSTTNHGFDFQDLESLILASFTPTGSDRDIALFENDNTTSIAEYADAFPTSIGLFDPARTIGLPCQSNCASQRPTIRVGFDLVMQPEHP